MSHARTSPAGPFGGFSCVVPPVITRFLYTIGGEVKRVAAGQSLHDLGRVQVDHAVVAESFVRLSGLRVQRVQLAVARTEHDLRRRLRVARPSIRRRAWPGCPKEAGRPRSPCPWSAPAPRRANTAWSGTSMPSMTSGVTSLGRNPDPPRPLRAAAACGSRPAFRLADRAAAAGAAPAGAAAAAVKHRRAACDTPMPL